MSRTFELHRKPPRFQPCRVCRSAGYARTNHSSIHELIIFFYAQFHSGYCAYVLFVATLFATLAETRFSLISCWYADCVQQNAQGTWCYVPHAAATRQISCIAEQADFQSVMQVHLNQGLSIAFYRGADNSLLGGSNWPVPSYPGVVRLCMSGQAGDGSFLTTCVNAAADNQINGNYGTPVCQVALPQRNVTDGCYDPNRTVPGTLSGSTKTTTAFSSGSTQGSGSGSATSAASAKRPILVVALVASGVAMFLSGTKF